MENLLHLSIKSFSPEILRIIFNHLEPRDKYILRTQLSQSPKHLDLFKCLHSLFVPSRLTPIETKSYAAKLILIRPEYKPVYVAFPEDTDEYGDRNPAIALRFTEPLSSSKDIYKMMWKRGLYMPLFSVGMLETLYEPCGECIKLGDDRMYTVHDADFSDDDDDERKFPRIVMEGMCYTETDWDIVRVLDM